MAITPPIRRSRLVKLESKRLARQTVGIVIITVIFLVAFFAYGIPTLMKLAVAIGNSKATSKFTAQEDKIPPLPPFIYPLTSATTSAILQINGTAESGSKIILYSNHVKVTDTFTDNQGGFVFNDVHLEKDSNIFYTIALDAAGNSSQESTSQTVVLDNTPPELTIDSPKDGARYTGEINQIISISGSTDKDVQLTVNDRHIIVTGDGTFINQYSLSDGENKLKFKAVDKAGNENIIDITLHFSR